MATVRLTSQPRNREKLMEERERERDLILPAGIVSKEEDDSIRFYDITGIVTVTVNVHNVTVIVQPTSIKNRHRHENRKGDLTHLRKTVVFTV